MTLVNLIDQNDEVLLANVEKATHDECKKYDNKMVISATYTFVDGIITGDIDWGNIPSKNVALLTIKIQL